MEVFHCYLDSTRSAPLDFTLFPQRQSPRQPAEGFRYHGKYWKPWTCPNTVLNKKMWCHSKYWSGVVNRFQLLRQPCWLTNCPESYLTKFLKLFLISAVTFRFVFNCQCLPGYRYGNWKITGHALDVLALRHRQIWCLSLLSCDYLLSWIICLVK